MWKSLIGLALVTTSANAWGASNSTDFGIRTFGVPTATLGNALRIHSTIDLRSIAGLGSHWGRVTSTYRSAEHNRAVGGVHNSYHLSGRAIDIARRPGVTHSQIAAAFRNAGYYLIESLDEGDHSHFAFGGVGSRGLSGAAGSVGTAVAIGASGLIGTASAPVQRMGSFKALRGPKAAPIATQWGMVSASGAVLK